MSVNDAYANADKYKALFGKSVGDNDIEIDAQLLALSRVIERELWGGRFLTKDDAVTDRYYLPSGTRTLNVEDIADLTGLVVKVDDNEDGTCETTLTITTDFEVWPLNAGAGPEPGPYCQLLIPSRVTSRDAWDHRVKVTAVHGWPAIPEAAAQGVCFLLSMLRTESPFASTRIAEGLDSVIGQSAQARNVVDMLLRPYAKPPWVYS